ncbi:hypothetical protein LUZ63_009784 [Rhynchospora breviuscula]|uniref:F-box domain-containing protein n=1 Tax=Rhynchospora breviuscula TaxID=2022672 RepID=A0A9Q0HNX6_9POAL|nr:hypothetical protein LUZ63_009784 [Rhynchospora breviuscula]
MGGADRISELHDTLLTHILSYLPTKEVVRTCLLSKRWRNVWASVPVLDFDFADFLSDDIFSPGKNVTVQTECHNNFVRFVDAVLQQARQLDRFRLVWLCQVNYYWYYELPLTRWIPLVLQKRPRVLSIYVQSRPVSVDVPDLAFTCSSLEEMKLRVDYALFNILNPVSVCLPHLRKLNLGYLTIEAGYMNKLLLGCPNLGELELYACVLNFSQISGGNLKSLVISGCYYESAELWVSAPSLQYLEVAVMSCQTAGFVFENMSSLVKACVCFLTVDYLEWKFSDIETNILNGLFGVENLDVVLYGSWAKYMLEHALESCPFFENLKAAHVESFEGYLYGCIEMIDRLVQHAPILEDLTFHCYKDKSDEIELLMELRKVVGDHRNCRSVESMQGHSYGSLDELERLSLEYWRIFDKVVWVFEENEEEDEHLEAWVEEEAGEDVEADLEEEDKQDVVQ